jgi:hypothetical protein
VQATISALAELLLAKWNTFDPASPVKARAWMACAKALAIHEGWRASFRSYARPSERRGARSRREPLRLLLRDQVARTSRHLVA